MRFLLKNCRANPNQTNQVQVFCALRCLFVYMKYLEALLYLQMIFTDVHICMLCITLATMISNTAAFAWCVLWWRMASPLCTSLHEMDTSRWHETYALAARIQTRQTRSWLVTRSIMISSWHWSSWHWIEEAISASHGIDCRVCDLTGLAFGLRIHTAYFFCTA